MNEGEERQEPLSYLSSYVSFMKRTPIARTSACDLFDSLAMQTR
jgi:hypothetical protein